jgi:hypothetical protein
MNERDKIIWAAGFVDGEGCISVNRQKMKRASKKGIKFRDAFTLGFAVTQKVKEPLEILHNMFGGHLFPYKLRGVTYWRWQHWSNGAKLAIEKLLPYLVVKRRIAELGVRFQEEMTSWNQEFGRRGYPDWVDESREAFYQQAKVMNKRGIADYSQGYVGPNSDLTITGESAALN